MNRTKFTPRQGDAYKNQGGGSFRCLRSCAMLPYTAVMQNVKSGWLFTAHDCGIYEDGTIDWDYSTGGRFEEVIA